MTYHRIEKVYYNLLDNTALVTILSYKDKSYRDKEIYMTSVRNQAESIYNLLTSETSTLESYQRESYSTKLIKAVDILKDDIKESYYITKHQVKIWDILDSSNINYIYNKLTELDLYSNAKEV